VPGFTLTTEAYLRAIINPGWNSDWDTTLTLLHAYAPALRTGFSNNTALAMALTAGSSINEATKYGLLNSAHLPTAITVGASARLTTWLATNTLAHGAILSA